MYNYTYPSYSHCVHSHLGSATSRSLIIRRGPNHNVKVAVPLQMTTKLSLDLANRIATNAIKAATSRSWNISVVVVDPSANVITMQKMDDCLPFGYPKFAEAKAVTCVTLGCSSRAFRDR